jgi:hypothetical protein
MTMLHGRLPLHRCLLLGTGRFFMPALTAFVERIDPCLSERKTCQPTSTSDLLPTHLPFVGLSARHSFSHVLTSGVAKTHETGTRISQQLDLRPTQNPNHIFSLPTRDGTNNARPPLPLRLLGLLPNLTHQSIHTLFLLLFAHHKLTS